MYDIPALFLSDSSLNKRYRSCARKFELNKLYGHARAEHEESLAAEAGTALHRAWQAYAETGNKSAGEEALLINYPAHLQPSSMDTRSLYACYSTYLEMIAHPIFSQYTLATVTVNGVERPAVEVPFQITFANVSLLADRTVPVHYIGYIDAIMWDTVAERYAVVDIKTTRKYRSDYSTMYKRDSQCLPYGYVLDRVIGAQAAELFDVLYLVAFIDPLEPRVMKYTFPKTRYDVAEWGLTVAKDIRDLQLFAAMGWFPKNGQACDTYGVCVYDNVCDYTDSTAIRQYLDLQFGPPNGVEFDNPWFTLSLEIEGLTH